MRVFKKLKGGRQFYATLGSLNLGAFCIGLTIGWSDPSLIYIVMPQESYKRTVKDDAVLQSSLNFGASLGALISICFVDTHGRKRSFVLAGAMDAASLIFLAAAGSVEIFVAAAFVGGLATGIFSTTVALYVTEISSSSNRGAVGAMVSFFISAGVLSLDFVATFGYLRIFEYLLPFLPAIFVISIPFWMVESPYFLYHRGKVLEAKLSLKRLRGTRTVLEIYDEFHSIQYFFNADINSSTFSSRFSRILCSKSIRKSVVIILPILCVSQMVGDYAMKDYFEEVINNMLPYYGRISLASLDVLFVGICFYMIEKVDRKSLMIISVNISALSCLVLAVYRFVVQQKCQMGENGAALIVIILIYCCFYNLGLVPILPLFTGEIFPSRVKTIAVSCCMMLVYIINVTIQRIYQSLNESTGVCIAFFVFALLGSAGTPLTVVSMPETRGKSLYQIQEDIEDIIIIS